MISPMMMIIGVGNDCARTEVTVQWILEKTAAGHGELATAQLDSSAIAASSLNSFLCHSDSPASSCHSTNRWHPKEEDELAIGIWRRQLLSSHSSFSAISAMQCYGSSQCRSWTGRWESPSASCGGRWDPLLPQVGLSSRVLGICKRPILPNHRHWVTHCIINVHCTLWFVHCATQSLSSASNCGVWEC